MFTLKNCVKYLKFFILSLCYFDIKNKSLAEKESKKFKIELLEIKKKNPTS